MKIWLYVSLCVGCLVANDVNIVNKPLSGEEFSRATKMLVDVKVNETLDVFDLNRAKPPLMMNVDKTNLAILYLLRNDTKAMKEIVQKNDFDVFGESKIVLGDKEFTGKSYSFASALVAKKRFDILDAIFANMQTKERQMPYLHYLLYVSIDEEMSMYRYLLAQGISPMYHNNYGDTTLTRLCQYAPLEDVKHAIDQGATINTANPLFLQNAFYGKKYDTVRYLLEHYAFDINMKPYDNRYFPSFLFYPVALDVTSENEKALFFEVLAHFSDESINTYGEAFMQRLKKSNAKLYEIAKTDKRLKNTRKMQ